MLLSLVKHRLPSPRRAASQPERTRVGRPPARRSLWPDAAGAQHRRVPFDPALGDVENLNKLVEQLLVVAEHMPALKAGIERPHETVGAHAAHSRSTARASTSKPM